jgi:O-antigen ligase
LRTALQVVLLALFIFAALAYGGVHYWANGIVFGTTFLLCAIVFLQSGIATLRGNPQHERSGTAPATALRGPFMIFLAAFMICVCFQLVPLSDGHLKALSPYAAYLYGQVQALTAPEGADSVNQALGYLSLDRDKTLKSLLAFAAYLGFGFLLSRTVRSPRDVKRCAVVLIVFSAGLALYGLLSTLNASPKLAGWKNPLLEGGRVSATLVNPDHFGGYLVMAIYLTAGYLAAILRDMPPGLGRGRRQRWVSRLNAEGSEIPKAFLLLFLIGVLTVVLLYTLSRGAVIGLSVSMIVCLVLLFSKTRRPVFLLLMALPAAFIIYYVQTLGADPLLERLEQTRKEWMELDDNARVLFYRAGLDLWQRFALFGSGLGSFEVVYPMMLPKIFVDMYIPYMHNDWLQLAVETGWIGGGLFVLAVGLLFVRILLGWWRTSDPWGFGLGLAAMGAMIAAGSHAFIDFGLRIPINAMFLVLLASLALVTLDGGLVRRENRQRRSAGADTRRPRSLPGRGAADPPPPGLPHREEAVGGPLRPLRTAGTGGGGLRRSAAALSLLLAAAGSSWSALQVGRHAVAQYYCPTEIDTVSDRREYRVDLTKLQRALELNPLNGEYWLNLAMLAEMPDTTDPNDGNSSASEGPPGDDRPLPAAMGPEPSPEAPSAKGTESAPDIDPRTISGWEKIGLAYGSLQDWAYARALSHSPAAGEYWLAYADHMRETLLTDQEERGGQMGERTVRSYDMALELEPNNSGVRARAAEFLEWLRKKDLPDD